MAINCGLAAAPRTQAQALYPCCYVSCSDNRADRRGGLFSINRLFFADWNRIHAYPLVFVITGYGRSFKPFRQGWFLT